MLILLNPFNRIKEARLIYKLEVFFSFLINNNILNFFDINLCQAGQKAKSRY